MTKRPKEKLAYLQFFPTDWRSDPRLRMCSAAARGLWIEMMCLMHEAEPYGHLLVSGQRPTDAQLAVLAGIPPDQLPALLGELEAAGVFSRTKQGAIYSRRMTRDEKKRRIARKNGKSGGNPRLGNKKKNPALDNPPDKPPDKAQSPESRVQSIHGGGGARARASPPVNGSDPLLGDVIELAGIDLNRDRKPQRWFGSESRDTLAQWRGLGLTDEEIRETVGETVASKPDGPPGSLAYFNPAMQRRAGRKARPPLQPNHGSGHDQRSGKTARESHVERELADDLEWARNLDSTDRGRS